MTLENLKLADIAEHFRGLYPDAVSVTFFVNECEHELNIQYKDVLDGYSMKMLNGKWAKGKNNGK